MDSAIVTKGCLMGLVLGVRFEDETNVVATVQPTSMAARLGILPGDRILRLSPGGALTSLADYDRISANLEPGDLREVELERDGEVMTLTRDFEPSVPQGNFIPPGDYSPLGTMNGIVTGGRVVVGASTIVGAIVVFVRDTNVATPGSVIVGALAGFLAGLPVLLILRGLREIVRVLQERG